MMRRRDRENDVPVYSVHPLRRTILAGGVANWYSTGRWSSIFLATRRTVGVVGFWGLVPDEVNFGL
jgi:hypothetical protein